MSSHGVWKHYDKIPDDVDKVKCIYCNAKVSCRDKKTKNMWKHVKKCHPDEIGENQGLTPYQGTHRGFGEYRCSKCNHRWRSANSWANSGQKCKKCNISVYPHTQMPLRNPGRLDVCDKSKSHLQELCDMCLSLGYNCRELRRRKKQKKNTKGKK